MDRWALSELDRRLANLIRVGVVAELDESSARVRVKSGEILTAWLPWLTHRAGQDRTWWAPEPGEQVLLLAPNGDMARGFVLPSLYQDASPPPGDRKTLHRTEYADGTSVEYDREAGHLTVDCVGDVTIKGARTLRVEFGGPVEVIAPTVTVDSPQSTFTGAVTIEGLLTYLAGMAGSGGSGPAAQINGSIAVNSGDVTADNISLKGHTHTGVTPGGGSTGTPQ